MTVKTLTYIHELLKEEDRRQAGAYKLIRDAAQRANEEDAPNKQTLHEQEQRAWQRHVEALNALAEFESKEW